MEIIKLKILLMSYISYLVPMANTYDVIFDKAGLGISNLTAANISIPYDTEKIVLKDNNIIVVPRNFFNNLSAIKEIDLDNNEIEIVEDSAFIWVPTLTHVRMRSNNLMEINPNIFLGLNELIFLDVSYNPINIIERNTFSDLKKLRILYLYGGEPENIEYIHKDAFFDITSIESLYLADNNLQNISTHLLSEQKQLRILKISRNEIEFLHPSLFSNLTELQLLYIEQNRIEVIDETLFKGLVQLRTLGIQNNMIRTLLTGTFSDLVSLTRLYISGNKLISLSQNVFSLVNHPPNLNKFRIDGNAGLECNVILCWLFDAQWDWITIENSNSIICSSPLSLTGRSWTTITDEDLQCPCKGIEGGGH